MAVSCRLSRVLCCVRGGRTRQMVVVSPKPRLSSPSATNDLRKQLLGPQGPGNYLSRSQDSLSPVSTPGRRITNPQTRCRPQSSLGLPKVNSVSSSLSGLGSRLSCKSAPSTPIKEEDSRVLIRKQNNQAAANARPPARRAASQQADARINKTKLTVTELQNAKKDLESQLAELTKKADSRQAEIANLKMDLRAEKEARDFLIEKIRNENECLKRQLWQLGITDDCKEEALNRHNALALQSDAATSPMIARKSLTPLDVPSSPNEDANDSSGQEWDKQSICSQLSEVSLACLQDRIVQMEETHHSTNEELQATLQELTDLQDIVDELVKDNQTLAEDNKTLMECRQHQGNRLDQYRLQIENMKHLLLSANNSNASHREAQLIQLLKSMAEEHEDLKTRYLEASECVATLRDDASDKSDMVAIMRDRNRLLETQLDSVLQERDKLDSKLIQASRQHDRDSKENQRLANGLEKERSKVEDVLKQLKAEGTGELQQLLDCTRREKDKAEERCVSLEEALAKQRAQAEQHLDRAERLEREIESQEQSAAHINSRIDTLQNQVEVANNQAMQYRAQALELGTRCSRLVEDKKEYKAQILALQSASGELVGEKEKLEKELKDALTSRQIEADDWKQFQADLQTAVVVANDFKMEAQTDMETLAEENVQLREKIASVNSEFDRLKALARANNCTPTSTSNSPALKSRLQVYLRNAGAGTSVGNKRVVSSPITNVKTLIESMEKERDSPIRGVASTSPVHSALMRSPGSVSRHNLQSASPSLSCGDESPSKSEIRPTSVSGMDQLVVNRPSLKQAISDTNMPKMSLCGVGDVRRTLNAVDEGERKGILVNGPVHKNSVAKSAERKAAILDPENKDPLAKLMKDQPRGSRRNALLKWCQLKVRNYENVEVTNFSSSWNDGLAFCALLHSHVPNRIPYSTLDNKDKKNNFSLAFRVAQCLGIEPTLGVDEMIGLERPDWQMIMAYVTHIYTLIES